MEGSKLTEEGKRLRQSPEATARSDQGSRARLRQVKARKPSWQQQRPSEQPVYDPVLPWPLAGSLSLPWEEPSGSKDLSFENYDTDRAHSSPCSAGQRRSG